ncbi:unnamed protein product [Closterium sp. Naga37s-1]|nr:unnamed protein product [Closterium sp. Naga37s-1]
MPAYMPKAGVQWDMSLAQHSLDTSPYSPSPALPSSPPLPLPPLPSSPLLPLSPSPPPPLSPSPPLPLSPSPPLPLSPSPPLPFSPSPPLPLSLSPPLPLSPSPPLPLSPSPPLPLSLSPPLPLPPSPPLPPHHQNDWYDFQGEMPAYMPKVGVQWDMSLAQHSLPDGFCHVAASNSRRYVVSRNAEGIWAPIEVADGAGGMKLPFMIKFFFAHTTRLGGSIQYEADGAFREDHRSSSHARSPLQTPSIPPSRIPPATTSRLGCSIQYEADGAFRTSVAVEDSLDTNERRPADWVSPTWGLGGLSSRLPGHLPPVPALDDKTVVGTRTVLTRNLMVQERENVSWAEEWSPNGAAAAAPAAASAAAGFMGRVPQGDEEKYEVFSLPQGVVVCVPRSLQLVAGRPFVLSATWVVESGGGVVQERGMSLSAGAAATAAAGGGVGREAVGAVGVVMCAPRSLQLVAGRPFELPATWVAGAGVAGEGEAKRISAYWGADGGFEKVEGEWYRRQACRGELHSC